MKDILLILFAHFVADFIFQSDKQAIEKSKSNYWLTMHVATYTGVIMLFAWFIFDNTNDVINWAFINGAIHWIQDYLTSRLNAKLWRENKRHWFFVSIGFDQFMHYCSLLLTYKFLN